MSNQIATLNPIRRVPPPEDVFPNLRDVRAAKAAAQGDRLGVFEALGFEGEVAAGIDTFSPLGVNLLMYAIVARDETAVLTLLDAGANPNVLTPQGISPMVTAGVEEGRLWLRLLLEKGGDPNLRNQYNEPLVHRLVYYGNWDNVHYLIERGADINAQDSLGHTALLRVVASNQFEEAVVLLDRGADSEIAGNEGLTVRRLVETSLEAPESPQAPWRKTLAERLGLRLKEETAKA